MIEPRPYDLDDKSERDRLIREVEGYMNVSLLEGTDRQGRRYAAYAMLELWRGIERGEFAVVKIVKKAAPPFVFDDEDALHEGEAEAIVTARRTA